MSQPPAESKAVDNNRLLDHQYQGSRMGVEISSIIKDLNESYIIRLTNLEAQVQVLQKEREELSFKVGQLTHQLRVSEQSRDILQKECEQFEITLDAVKREKEMYLNEFRYLKEKYQQTIDRLDAEVSKLKLSYKTVSEDNKQLQLQCDHYRTRMQELLDLHEIAALDEEEGFYHVLQTLKARGMDKITKEEMQAVRQDAFEQVSMMKTAKIVQKQLKAAKQEYEMFQSDEKPNIYPVTSKNMETKDDPWDEIYSNIDKIGKF